MKASNNLGKYIMALLILGLLVFLGIHSVRMFVPGLREVMIASIGDSGWKSLYSVASILGFVLLIWGYGQARAEAPILYIPPAIGASIAIFLMIPSFILLVASQLPAGRIKVATRHPMILGVILWSIAHLLANGDAASVVLFGSFLVWAVINRLEATRRGVPDFPAIQLRFDIIAIAGGFAAYLIFALWLHAWWIGVSPFG